MGEPTPWHRGLQVMRRVAGRLHKRATELVQPFHVVSPFQRGFCNHSNYSLCSLLILSNILYEDPGGVSYTEWKQRFCTNKFK